MCAFRTVFLIMTRGKAVLIVVYALCLSSAANVAKARGRIKRELRFPKGGSFVMALSLSSFLPKGPTDGLIHILEFDLGFPFPEQFSIEKKQAQEKFGETSHDAIKLMNRYKPKKTPGKRTKRNSKASQRKDLLLKIEDAINRSGFNGASCVSRFRCELRTISPENSLLEQLLLALFEPAPEGDCEKHQRGCPISLLQVVMHSEQLGIDVGR